MAASAALAIGWCGLAARQTAGRIAFPWDMLLWVDSPFMTSMVKLDQGAPLYEAAEQANSTIYSPGLDYLTYILLRPLGHHLDIRWCRAVNVLVGIAAAVAASLFALQFYRALARRPRARWPLLLLVPVCLLCVFRNLTADVCHPDNLHMLHFGLSALACAWAARKQRLWAAVPAILLAAGGLWVKQTAGPAGMGAALALALVWRGGWKQRVLLMGTGALATATMAAALWIDPSARYWTFDLLRAQPFSLRKVFAGLEDLDGPRMLLFFLLPAAGVFALRYPARGVRGIAAVALVLGAAEALPALLAYGKEFGGPNNWGILQLWAAVVVLPVLLPSPPGLPATARPSLAGPLGSWAFALLVLMLMPVKAPPPPEFYRYAERLEQRIAADVQARRRVLLAHGTMPLIRAGLHAVPIDRAGNVNELVTARAFDRIGLHRRIESCYYDRIYLNSRWYDTRTERMLDRYYRKTETLPALALPYRLCQGYQRLLAGPIVVLEPKPAASVARRTSGAAEGGTTCTQ